MTREEMKLIYHQDPGHGWVQVPIDLVQSVGATPSAFSYSDGENLYLEEDCDAPQFLSLAREKGIHIELSERHTNHDAFIRRLPSALATPSFI